MFLLSGACRRHYSVVHGSHPTSRNVLSLLPPNPACLLLQPIQCCCPSSAFFHRLPALPLSLPDARTFMLLCIFFCFSVNCRYLRCVSI